MFPEVPFMIVKIQKQSTCLLTNEWIKKSGIYRRILFSYKKEILPFVTYLEDFMLSEISQIQEDIYHLYMETKRVKLIAESGMRVSMY